MEIQKFFGVGSLGYIKKQSKFFSVAFRKHKKGKSNPYTLEAWLRLGRIKVQHVDVPLFDKDKLRGSLEEIAQLSCEDPKVYVCKLEKMLHDCGVVLACLPYLKNTHIQGAAMWIGNKPLIMVATNKKK